MSIGETDLACAWSMFDCCVDMMHVRLSICTPDILSACSAIFAALVSSAIVFGFACKTYLLIESLNPFITANLNVSSLVIPPIFAIFCMWVMNCLTDSVGCWLLCQISVKYENLIKSVGKNLASKASLTLLRVSYSFPSSGKFSNQSKTWFLKISGR